MMTTNKKNSVGPRLVWEGKDKISGFVRGADVVSADDPLVLECLYERWNSLSQQVGAQKDQGDQVGGEDELKPLGRLFLGDNKVWLRKLCHEFAGGIDLVYMDPPYGTGTIREILRGGGPRPHVHAGKTAFIDERANDGSYLDLMYEIFLLCRELLSPRGQIFVHVDGRASGIIRVLLDEVFGGASFRNEIVWHYGSGGRAKKFYARKSDSIFWYAKGRGYTFKPERIASPRSRCRLCGGLHVARNHLKKHTDEDGRIYRTIKSGGKIYRYYDDEPVPPTNVWMDIPIIQQRDPRRTGYPTQKPDVLLRRIISAHSEEGDLVLDPFCGSGTTPAMAWGLKRRCMGIDKNPLAVSITRERMLKNLDSNSGNPPLLSLFLPIKSVSGEGGSKECRADDLLEFVIEDGGFKVVLGSGLGESGVDHWVVGLRRRIEQKVFCFWWESRDEKGKLSYESPLRPLNEINGFSQMIVGLQKVDGNFVWYTIAERVAGKWVRNFSQDFGS